MPIHTVSDDAELRAAILAANDGDTIQFDADITLLADLPVVQDDITIDGDDHALNGADQFRGLFVGAWQAGTATQIPVSVTIQNLAIEDAAAIGGNGGSRGGGGAGLGGAVFVANLATVTVSNVSLIDNAATGGNGTGNASFDGGGGGMGGDGNNGDDGGGGSGGLGIGANGGLGNGFAGGAGIATGAASGAAGVVGGAGGVNGGGGGGAGAINAAGGGGGVGGTGKAGGFGGGGGGAGTGGGGDGGFGGGGGGGFVDGGGGAGGFGGGGGSAGPGSGSGGFGGFGGGDGLTDANGGGGGAGMGGGIFVQEGGTLILAGPLSINGNAVTGGSGAGGAGNGAALGSGLFLQGNGTITFNSGPGQTQTIDDGIADQTGSGGTGGDEGSYGLTKTGAGTLILNGANTYSGGTTLIGGVLNVGHTDALGTGTLTVLGATLEIQDEAPFNIHLSNSIDLRSDLTVNFVETVGGGSGGLTGTIDDTNGAFGITKTGNGILALTGNNSYAGATNIVGGAIRVMGGNAIGDLSAVNVGTGAFLELFGSGEAIGSLSGSGDVGNSSIFGVPLTFGHNNVDATFSGVFSFNLSLVKVGTGKQVLSGNSTSFGGFITVNGGTLQVDGALVNSIATVNAGGRLGGNGTTGEVNVAAGGKLAPGASAGILNTGSIALVAGAFFEAEIGGTTPGVGGYDQVKVTGTVSLGGATLDVSLLGGFVPSFGQSFTIIDNDGSDAVTGTFAGLAEGAVVDVGGYELLLTYTGGDGNDVALSTGVLITGTPGPDLVDAAHTVSGQPLPTAVGDEILGLAGKDSLSGLGGNDTIRGGNSADKLYGDAGNDTIQGQRGNDRLFGGDGDDWLAGGGQRDKLTGGEGDDTFVFTYLGRPNTITDFADGDVIALKKSGFPGIGPTGVLQAKYFHAGEAETAKQKVLYDAEGGWLLFAKHGSGTLIPRPIVKIGKNLDLDHTDILVI